MPLMVSIDHTWGEGDIRLAVEDRNTVMHSATPSSTDFMHDPRSIFDQETICMFTKHLT